jgi:hypothetical protein
MNILKSQTVKQVALNLAATDLDAPRLLGSRLLLNLP